MRREETEAVWAITRVNTERRKKKIKSKNGMVGYNWEQYEGH